MPWLRVDFSSAGLWVFLEGRVERPTSQMELGLLARLLGASFPLKPVEPSKKKTTIPVLSEDNHAKALEQCPAISLARRAIQEEPVWSVEKKTGFGDLIYARKAQSASMPGAGLSFSWADVRRQGLRLPGLEPLFCEAFHWDVSLPFDACYARLISDIENQTAILEKGLAAKTILESPLEETSEDSKNLKKKSRAKPKKKETIEELLRASKVYTDFLNELVVSGKELIKLIEAARELLDGDPATNSKNMLTECIKNAEDCADVVRTPSRGKSVGQTTAQTPEELAQSFWHQRLSTILLRAFLEKRLKNEKVKAWPWSRSMYSAKGVLGKIGPGDGFIPPVPGGPKGEKGRDGKTFGEKFMRVSGKIFFFISDVDSDLCAALLSSGPQQATLAEGGVAWPVRDPLDTGGNGFYSDIAGIDATNLATICTWRAKKKDEEISSGNENGNS